MALNILVTTTPEGDGKTRKAWETCASLHGVNTIEHGTGFPSSTKAVASSDHLVEGP